MKKRECVCVCVGESSLEENHTKPKKNTHNQRSEMKTVGDSNRHYDIHTHTHSHTNTNNRIQITVGIKEASSDVDAVATAGDAAALKQL